jgi:hypothetical protein
MNSANMAFAIAGVVLLTSGTCVSAGDVATVRVRLWIRSNIAICYSGPQLLSSWLHGASAVNQATKLPSPSQARARWAR